jgi:hypothetical protein
VREQDLACGDTDYQRALVERLNLRITAQSRSWLQAFVTARYENGPMGGAGNHSEIRRSITGSMRSVKLQPRFTARAGQ